MQLTLARLYNKNDAAQLEALSLAVAVERGGQLRHKKMAVSSTCNDGWHAYKHGLSPWSSAWLYAMAAQATTLCRRTSLSAQAASSAFFNAASPRAAAMALAKRRAVATESRVRRSIVGRKCLRKDGLNCAFAGCQIRWCGCKFRVVCHSSTLHSDSPGTMLQAALHRSCCRVFLRSVAPLVSRPVSELSRRPRP